MSNTVQPANNSHTHVLIAKILVAKTQEIVKE